VTNKSLETTRLEKQENRNKGKERIHQSKFIHFSIQPFRRAAHEHIPGNSYSAIPFSVSPTKPPQLHSTYQRPKENTHSAAVSSTQQQQQQHCSSKKQTQINCAARQ